MENLQLIFTRLMGQYTEDQKLIEKYYSLIEKKYNSSKRHYHNLEHLSNLFAVLAPCRSLIISTEAVDFAIFYHDIFYNVSRKDNELKSAQFARKQLVPLGIPGVTIELISAHIEATQTHIRSTNNDTNLFTDADLSILGSNPGTYLQYTKSIRKEYNIYPEILYKPGRKKVVEHFLAMPRIFKTPYFYEHFESPARENLLSELHSLL
ncbi:putative metal-dependent HD superfamily phosphohydrolase [Chitinophaga skermanii]|uniref:Putative metal-dependent HD superfamily phosphohydrolase n=1 Tax=Chitinophaga skermanii TaxID=331697 RepID=A0A327QQX0_9BACT|nr:hypothetical protein [Chitinophaga skermanii]RAJ06641.1 putative metal-dependent HD superfamily phosphohydrolase [Chitinophaga skermanii]